LLGAALFLITIPLPVGGIPKADTLPVVCMAETLPQDSLAPLPFTREEYVRAHLQVRSASEAESLASGLFDTQAPEVIGVHVMDGDLLLLAALSDEIASRVCTYRPSLDTLVRRVRADPEGFLKSWRADTEAS
jgi:hypothetical protein